MQRTYRKEHAVRKPRLPAPSARPKAATGVTAGAKSAAKNLSNAEKTPSRIPTARRGVPAHKHATSKAASSAVSRTASVPRVAVTHGSLPIGVEGEPRVDVSIEHCAHRLFEDLWQDGALCDVILKVDDRQFPAHRLLLAASSEYFKQLFLNKDLSANDQFEISLRGVSGDAVDLLLRGLYTGNIPLYERYLLDILAASRHLKLQSITSAVEKHILSSLCVDNCLRRLPMCFSHGLNAAVGRALEIAAANFDEVSDLSDFTALSPECVLALLQRDDLCCDNELHVFRKAALWIQSDIVGRLRVADGVLATVRLPLIPPHDLVDHVETVEFVMAIPACQDLVKEALHYHCIPARQSILQSPRTVPRHRARHTGIAAVGGAPRLKSEPPNPDVMFYALDTGEWSFLCKVKHPCHHHAVATLGGFLYIAGGEATNEQEAPLSRVHRYDTRTGKWLQVASMRRPRESFQLVALYGMLYAVGGRLNQEESLADVECYNPATDTWEDVASLSSARRSVAVAAHSGRLYAVGGSGNRMISSKVERYNPTTNQWESRRPLARPRFFAQLASVGSRLYLVGGATVDEAGNLVCARTVECYSPASDTWTEVAPMLVPRAEAGLVAIGNMIYVLGGYSWDTRQRLSSVERYDTEADAWTAVSEISRPYTGIGGAMLTLYERTDGGSSFAFPSSVHVASGKAASAADRNVATASTNNDEWVINSRILQAQPEDTRDGDVTAGEITSPVLPSI
ncbi:PREDICTED: kelch-like protein 26 [Priapulus caudatus]|uniref:Kelch-like protein 26 n=1 Tax=Priapulus caudatus TaxID=37621 RepID=A0ABM1EA09_PRICU|nr:PREDICTED: kelch-like protein 26 [Priapulus caudatus]